jgi:hypothetical protein
VEGTAILVDKQHGLKVVQAELDMFMGPVPKLIVRPDGNKVLNSSKVKQHSGGGGGSQQGARQLKIDI